MNKIRLSLTLTVDYKLNGESPELMKRLLLQLANRAIDNGRVTGATAAEVDSWEAAVVGAGPELQTPDHASSEDTTLRAIHSETDGEFLMRALSQLPAPAGVNSPLAIARWLATLDRATHVYIDEDGLRLQSVGDDNAYLEIGGRPRIELTERMFIDYMVEQDAEAIDPEKAYRNACFANDGTEWRRLELARKSADGIRCKLELEDKGAFRQYLNNYADYMVKDKQWVTFDNGDSYYGTDNIRDAVQHFDESEYEYDDDLRAVVDYWL